MVKILVVKRDDLFGENHFEGFRPLGEHDFIGHILGNHYYEERNDELENNTEHLQIIPYVWIINPLLKKAFIYQRSLGKDYQETRHVNRYSGGVGGHIDEEEHEGDPIIHAMNRELREELVMNDYPNAKFIGYINDDSDMYNKVHFGIIGLAETHEDVIPTDDGIKSGSFYSIEEIERLFEDPDSEVESWTKLSWPHVKRYILNL